MFTKTFKQLTKKDVGIAGGKGASLGEMTRAGIPVPPGFVLLAPAFDRFLEETDLDMEIEATLKKVNHQDINSVDRASNEIRAMIARAKMPEDVAVEIMRDFKTLGAKYVAVRSSATAEDSSTAAWAGQLETYLNTTEKEVLKNVQLCWSSLFTPRAIFYRFEQKLSKKAVSVAVVIQAMVQSEVSGISFTVHPVTKDYNQMVIEAGFGLGEAIVSGQVTPDTYVIHKNDFSILDINVSEQSMMIVRGGKSGNLHKKLSEKIGGRQKLTGKQIVELAKICKNIEQHYKKPQDIEWAMVKNKFYITQSRPITTL
ncbi:MAG: PEP/pyruvate-binding domain-containing protein [Patescibacteria group bacterium]|nr:PEP/pyruvate-binding domain-containing protein [Patescibacteria group bacterium]